MLKTKLLAFLKEVRIIIRKNPFVSKSVFSHIAFVLFLLILAKISAMKFSFDSKIEIQVNHTKSSLPQVIEATSITSADLNKEIKAYEKRQDDIKQAQDDIKKAKQRAIQKAEDERQAKIAAEQKAKEEAIKKAALEVKQKADAAQQAKLEEQKKKELLEKQQKDKADAVNKASLEEQKKKELLEKQQKDAADSERRAKEKELSDAKAEAEAQARKQIEQNQADRAISSYISAYQDRVGDNWIKDSCRGIYDLPRAIIKNGQFIKLTGTSGSFSCDKSLIDAIKNTTPPTITNNAARQTIETESISFIFTQN